MAGPGITGPRAGSCGPSHIGSYSPAGAKAAGTLSLPEWMGEWTGRKECREVKSDQGHTAQTRREHKNASPNSGSDTGLSPGPKSHPLKELLPQLLGQGPLTPRKKKKKSGGRGNSCSKITVGHGRYNSHKYTIFPRYLGRKPNCLDRG